MDSEVEQADIVQRPETDKVNYRQTMAEINNDDDPDTDETPESLDMFGAHDIDIENDFNIQYHNYEKKDALKESYVE